MRRRLLIALMPALTLLIAASTAQAVVVNDQGTVAGVALVPGGTPGPSAMPVTSNPPCLDPTLPSDLVLPSIGLCYHGGAVMHGNETFALTWDPLRRYWETTRNYLEQFLGDVSSGSGTLTSPYALTGQYTDPGGHAANASIYGGGCIDFGNVGGSACQFHNSSGSGPGHDYPANGCPVVGASETGPNDTCLTDAQIQNEVKTMVAQTGILGRVTHGATPLVMVLLPGGVQACLDANGALCSATIGATSTGAQFCSYHSQVNVGGTAVAYVVQPWTPYTRCDEPHLPALPQNPTPLQLAIDAGVRMSSPFSQGQIAAIVNPGLNGWSALDGSEITDNRGCGPTGYPFDQVTVGTSSQNPYYLAREFNNSGVIQSDPNSPQCWLGVSLSPAFIVPSGVKLGDEVQFDGSTTISTLIVPRSGYFWDFGDGTTSVGPSVVHSYAKGGTYAVKLTVVDLGGDVGTLSQTITVLGPVTPPPKPGLHARMLLMPQGLRSVLRSGVALFVSSNEPADGIATLSIPRGAARRAQINVGRGASVVIGRGTVSGISSVASSLHLRLSPGVVAKLKRLRHVVVTVRISLVAAGGQRVSIDAAGHY